jgi:hypothetical protein
VIRPILGAVLALALLSSAAPGQGIGQGEVVAACAGSEAQQGNCLTVLRAYLQGLAPATRNTAVGDLVVALASLPEASRATAAAAIREAARFSSDTEQVVRIGEIAATIAAGGGGETAAIAETSSSPA